MTGLSWSTTVAVVKERINLSRDMYAAVLFGRILGYLHDPQAVAGY